MEKTLVLVKPDGVERRLVGEIIARFERRGFAIRGLKLLRLSRGQAESHYAEHRDKPFFAELVAFITSGPVVAMAVAGEDAVRTVRAMLGRTAPADSPPGTIRGDFALDVRRNVVHGSDSPQSAAREIANFFSPDELCE